MLTRWTIGNFKSIARTMSLELAPLTLLCGANSSGKSTILQSMLAVAQTVHAGSRTRPLVLNGPLIRLGGFPDLTHAGNEGDHEMRLGFALQLPHGLQTPADQIEVDVSVLPSDEPVASNQQLLPFMREYEVRWRSGGDSSDTTDSVLRLAYGRSYDNRDFDYRIERFDGIETRFVLSGDLRPTHFSIGGFIPTGMLVEYNVAGRHAGEDFEHLISIVSEPESPALPDSIMAQPVPNSIWRLLLRVQRQSGIRFQQELGELLELADRQPMTWKRLLQIFRSEQSPQLDPRRQPSVREKWPRGVRTILRDRLLGLKAEWLKDIERREPETTYERRNVEESLQAAANQMRSFWLDRFAYLGPLRDDPKVVYAAPTDTERRNVGTKGEFTAAVLTEARDTVVDYPLPPEGDASSVSASDKAPLHKAVVRWLHRMGLLDAVDGHELAKIGYELTVRSVGLERPLDLMNVGVGVSQVLPTLVMSLIAPAGSTLVFEQPELHMHPGVQSILGDFFLGMAALGKQCIIETHSEHLINRVRRRIAEGEGDSVMKLVRVYFGKARRRNTHHPCEAQ